MERVIELNESLDTATFYGVNNQNILCLKNQHPDVRIVARGYQIKVVGAEAAVEKFEERLHLCEAFCIQHNILNEEQILKILHGEQPMEEQPDNLIVHGVNGKSVTARSKNQQALVKAFAKNDLLFAIGPAGTGKTYTAIALAVKSLKSKEVKKIILSRPAVEAGEKLGFLPGDMKEKIDPYLQPLYDALEDMLPKQKLQEYLEKGVIQIAPLAFMRGRTLGNAVVVLDEAQNTTIPQIKMFMTRLGLQGKMIITGDLTQVDLPSTQRSGLRDAIEVLEDTKGVSIIHFNRSDVVRHPLVERIIAAYEKKDNQSSQAPKA